MTVGAPSAKALQHSANSKSGLELHGSTNKQRTIFSVSRLFIDFLTIIWNLAMNASVVTSPCSPRSISENENYFRSYRIGVIDAHYVRKVGICSVQMRFISG